MPEGPSIAILREEAQRFAGKRIVAVAGNTTIAKERLLDQRIVAIRSWGKHFLVELKTFSLRIHFLMFGSWRIDERKDGATPRLSLQFRDGELNVYTCSVRFIEEPLDDVYDWSADVLSDAWDAAAARRKLRAMPETLVCDALLDQNVFSGVGNIIKNEVLFRIKVNPKTLVGNLPPKKRKELIDEAVNYSFDFLEWKKEYTLRKHWLAHTKRTCPRDGSPILKEYLGKTNRRTFYCPVCQKLYE